MGWTGSSETTAQVRLSFDTKEEAVAFAEKHGIAYRVEEPAPDQERRGLSYSDNFKPTASASGPIEPDVRSRAAHGFGSVAQLDRAAAF